MNGHLIEQKREAPCMQTCLYMHTKIAHISTYTTKLRSWLNLNKAQTFWIQWLGLTLQQPLQLETFGLSKTRRSYLHHLFHFCLQEEWVALSQAFLSLPKPAADIFFQKK